MKAKNEKEKEKEKDTVKDGKTGAQEKDGQDGAKQKDMAKVYSQCMTITKKTVRHDRKTRRMKMRTKKVRSKRMMNTIGEECTRCNHQK